MSAEGVESGGSLERKDEGHGCRGPSGRPAGGSSWVEASPWEQRPWLPPHRPRGPQDFGEMHRRWRCPGGAGHVCSMTLGSQPGPGSLRGQGGCSGPSDPALSPLLCRRPQPLRSHQAWREEAFLT